MVRFPFYRPDSVDNGLKEIRSDMNRLGTCNTPSKGKPFANRIPGGSPPKRKEPEFWGWGRVGDNPPAIPAHERWPEVVKSRGPCLPT